MRKLELVGRLLSEETFRPGGRCTPGVGCPPLPERMFEEGERIGACQADDGCHKLSREPVDELLDAIDLRPVRMELAAADQNGQEGEHQTHARHEGGQLPVKADIELSRAERFEREKLTSRALTVDCRFKKPGGLLYCEGLAV